MPPSETTPQYVGIHTDLLRRESIGTPQYEVCGGVDETLLPLREVFMLALMERLTDKPGWHTKVFDAAIVARWRNEALEQSEKELFNEIVHQARKPVKPPGRAALEEDSNSDSNSNSDSGPKAGTAGQVRPPPGDDELTIGEYVPFPARDRFINGPAFRHCIRELRDRASHFEQTGFVRTLNSISRRVVKSDTLVGHDLNQSLRDAFEELRDFQKESDTVDWHPRTNEMVQDLVHPSLYPFIYGQSPFFPDEIVGLTDAVENWAGKGEPAPAEPVFKDTLFPEGIKNWSTRYQWLPANMAFQGDGSVRFTSYINNLHPRKFPHIYRSLEKLVDLAIPAWDEVLQLRQPGPRPRKKGRFEYPKRAHDYDNEELLWEPMKEEILANHPIQPTKKDLEHITERSEHQLEDETYDDNGEPTAETMARRIKHWRWRQIRDPVHPEPTRRHKYSSVPHEVSLRHRFRDSGLQVIVKMVRIELTPERPDFPAGGWHVEGLMNERICATALYYLDSENITPSSLAFRTETEGLQMGFRRVSGQYAFTWLEKVYGVNLKEDRNLQYWGRVETREGRMLAFPNVFQHRVTPFSLKDRTKPGHRCFIALWLVDPNCRIVSTANVPPQQLDWWAETTSVSADRQRVDKSDLASETQQLALETKGDSQIALPSNEAKSSEAPETTSMERGRVTAPRGLMTLDEAKEHRLRLMDERTTYATETNEAVHVGTYDFCEH